MSDKPEKSKVHFDETTRTWSYPDGTTVTAHDVGNNTIHETKDPQFEEAERAATEERKKDDANDAKKVEEHTKDAISSAKDAVVSGAQAVRSPSPLTVGKAAADMASTLVHAKAIQDYSSARSATPPSTPKAKSPKNHGSCQQQ